MRFFEIQGVQVGSKNRSKKMLKTMRKQKASETRFLSIFDGFGSDIEKASKFDQFLKASWNAIFSAQEPPRGASAADRRRRWSRPEATGGGFRRGKQEPPRRRIQKEDGRKDSETSCAYSTRRPEMGGGLKPPWGEYRRPMFSESGPLR